MSHLHLPDGVVPAWLWVAGWVLAVIAGAIGFRREATTPQRVARVGALSAVMLAAMAIELPLGPVEFHLTLAGPFGVLLGGFGAFHVALVSGAILAFAGHGGFSLIGLNAIVLGLEGAVASLVYPWLARGRAAAPAMAGATAVARLVAGGLWILIMAIATDARARDTGMPARYLLLTSLSIPLLALGLAIESAVAFGIARFLERVRPDLVTRGAMSLESLPEAEAR
jgi:cobalt/nickel transport system permease protein